MVVLATMSTRTQADKQKIRKDVKNKNPDLVRIPTVKPVILKGEQPPHNPNAPSGVRSDPTINGRRKWVRCDGTVEGRVQCYLPLELARRMRKYCATANGGMGITMGSFMTEAVEDLLAKVGER